MARIEYIAGVDLQVGGKLRPAGSPVPEAATWKNLGAYVRTKQIILRGSGAEHATAAYVKEPPRGRAPNADLLREAIAKGEHADDDLEKPLLDPDEATGEALEREGVTVDDIADDLIAEAAAQAAAEEEVEGEEEAVELDPEAPRRGSRRRRGSGQ